MSWADLSYQHPRSGEWAHDVRDPLRESLFTSVQPAWHVCPPPISGTWRWLEIGFGRGINSAVAWRELQRLGLLQAGLHVSALGCDPCLADIKTAPELPAAWQLQAPWWGRGPGRYELPDGSGQLEVVGCGIIELLENRAEWHNPDLAVDWVFLDLFSPGKHPEDWQGPILPVLSQVVRQGSALTTYCCARWLREQLEQAGWQPRVLKRKGLRDTLVAVFAGSPAPV